MSEAPRSGMVMSGHLGEGDVVVSLLPSCLVPCVFLTSLASLKEFPRLFFPGSLFYFISVIYIPPFP